MTIPLSSPQADSAAPLSADYYEKLVTTKPPFKLRGRHLLLGVTLLLSAGEYLHVRHVRANDALRMAVMDYDVPQTRALLRDGANPNQRFLSVLDEMPGLWRYLPGSESGKRGAKSKTLLMMAAGVGNADMVQLLLAYGADPNVKLPNGLTALLASATTRDPQTLPLLLAKGADFHVHNSDGHAALHLAALTGNANAVAALLDAGADLEEKDPHGQTALCIACGSRHEDVVELLLARGANTDALTTAQIEHMGMETRNNSPYAQMGMQQKQVPLLWAAQQGSPSLVRYIWDKKLDAEARQTLGIAALSGAISSGVSESAQALLERGVPVEPDAETGPRQSLLYGYSSPLLAAAGTRNLTLCRLLLERGAKVNHGLTKNYGGTTPLMAAAMDTDGRVIELLLAHGAEVNARNAQGETPLMLAANSPAATRLLLAHGAEVNARDDRGSNALMHSYNGEVMLQLLKAGADASGEDQNMMLLTRVNTPEVVSLLIAQGAKVNQRDQQGKTALMQPFSDEVAGVLLEHGADANARDNMGQTVLHIAVTQSLVKRISMLVAHGADLNVTNAEGLTPLALAKKLNNMLAADALIKAGAAK